MAYRKKYYENCIRLLSGTLLCTALFLGSGCGSDTTRQPDKPKIIRGKIVDLRKFMEPAGKGHKRAGDSKKADLKTNETDAENDSEREESKISGYDPEGKIDPFKPFIRESSRDPQPLKSKRRKHLTPLEKLDIGQMRLVGIIRIPDGNIAMIEEASGKGYVIKKNTYIGLNSGQVSRILKDKIVIEEKFVDFTGKTVVRKKELKLQKPHGDD